MKKIIYLLYTVLVFMIFNKTVAKEKFVEKYNYALSGINLREDKTLNSRILLNIPYGEKVFVLNETSDYFEVDNIIGNWVKVRYKDVEGYVFGGYLSVMPAPNRKHFSVDKIYSIKEYNSVYFRNKGKLISKKENDYLYKTYFTVENASVLECFLLFRLIEIYPQAGLVNLPQKKISYRNEKKAIEVTIDVFKNSENIIKRIDIILLYYNSSGRTIYHFEKINQKDVLVTITNELP